MSASLPRLRQNRLTPSTTVHHTPHRHPAGVGFLFPTAIILIYPNGAFERTATDKTQYDRFRFIEAHFSYSGSSQSGHIKNGATISVIPSQRTSLPANPPQPTPESLSHCPRLALSSTLRHPFYLSSPSVMGERWENDGRTED